MAVEAPAAPAGSLKGMSGVQKAAALLVAIGEQRASEIIRHLGETEVEALSLEIAKARKVPAEVCKEVVSEAVETVMAEEYIADGGVDFARSVLERSLGASRAEEIIGRLAATIERRPFEFLRRTPAEQISVFLRNEAPQTIALIVANLHTSLASQVLSHLPAGEQADIALRIARMGETSPEVVKQVEGIMKRKLDSVVQQEYSSAGGIKSLAEILNHADRSTERNVLDALTESDEELAAEVRRLLFVFEDIVKLDERAIQQVLREVDQKDLVLALRGAPENLMDAVLTNMSERGAAMLKEEMEIQQPQRQRDVDEAQSRIVTVVRKLDEAGTIVIGGEEEDGEGEAVV